MEWHGDPDKLRKKLSKYGYQERINTMEPSDDHERFTRLLIEHEPALLRCVLVAIPNRADARDVLQECSVALWRQFGKYDPQRPFVPWALGFVRIEIRRFLRQTQRRAQLTARAAELLDFDQQSNAQRLDARAQLLQRCMKRLPEEHRELLSGYYHQERSVAELAQSCGRSVEAVYKMLQRIRGSLHHCIENSMRGAQA